MKLRESCSAIGLITLSTFLIAPPCAEATGRNEFGYACETCPTAWAALRPEFEACFLGTMQSPIAIGGRGTRRGEKPALAVRFEESDFEVVRPNTTNFEAEAEAGTRMGITIGDTEYELLQFHFHSLSEHLMNGERFPLEAHFVHRTGDGGLAVLGMFIEEGDENEEIEKLIDILGEVEDLEVGQHTELDDFDPRELLPGDLSTSRYLGSTTTPPCVEGVQWLLLKKRTEMSRSQIHDIQDVIRNYNDGFDNNRPVQSRDGRLVKRVLDRDDDSDSGDSDSGSD